MIESIRMGSGRRKEIEKESERERLGAMEKNKIREERARHEGEKKNEI